MEKVKTRFTVKNVVQRDNGAYVIHGTDENGEELEVYAGLNKIRSRAAALKGGDVIELTYSVSDYGPRADFITGGTAPAAGAIPHRAPRKGGRFENESKIFGDVPQTMFMAWAKDIYVQGLMADGTSGLTPDEAATRMGEIVQATKRLAKEEKNNG